MKGEEKMVEVKKRKVEGDPAEEVAPSKKTKKRNTFNVVDVDEEEEKDFLKLSRSQVVEEDGAGKKKKKKRKSAKNKPAINLAALGGISSNEGQEKMDTTEKAIGEKQSKKESGNKSEQVAKEKAGKKKTAPLNASLFPD